MYDEHGVKRQHRGTGEFIPRDPRTLPCRMPGDYNGSACPKESPTANVALTPENYQAYEHYQRCKAVGRFPEDSLVEHHAQVISEVIAQWERIERQRLAMLRFPT